MGLERVARCLQGEQNMYEIDVFCPVVATAEELTGKTYGPDATTASASAGSPTTSAPR